MTHPLTELQTAADLDAAIAGSFVRPLLLFKHSLTCGASAWALDEVVALQVSAPLPLDVRMIPVQTARTVSNLVAERFGIRHESPQALLVHRGQVVWHASHHGVRQSDMTAALARCHDAVPEGS